MPNISGLKTIARTGRDIILTVSNYSSTSFSDTDFEKFISDIESFVIAQSQISGSNMSNDKDDGEEMDVENEMETMEENWDF